MIKNYLKIAFRNLFKNKVYSFINIVGLSLGLAFSVLVILFVNDELTYDRFHENGENLYRLYRQPLMEEDMYDTDVYMPMPTAEALKRDIPEVEETVRLIPFGNLIIRKDAAALEKDGVLFTDPSFFDLFSFPLKLGDPATALTNPGSIVLSEDAADQIFGNRNPLGETLSLRLNGEFSEFEVTGVAKALPGNSTISFNILLPIQDVLSRYEDYARVENRWDATRNLLYVKLNDGTDVNLVQAKMPQFMNTHMGSMFDEMREDGIYKGDGPALVYRFQPMEDIHLNTGVPGGLSQPGNPSYSYILGGIALAVLLIACFNFMILSIGRSAKRAREVGIRKVSGAERGQIMFQFWAETFIVAAMAMAIGFLFTEFALPVFNELSGKSLSLGSMIESRWIVSGLIALFVVTGLVAGSYPALLLSGFKPIESLNERLNFSGNNALTRSLIMVQFSISVFLVAATLGMGKQLDFMQNKNLGFSGEQVVVVPLNGQDGERTLSLYRDILGGEEDIVEITGANVSFATGLWRRGYNYNGELMQTAVFRVDPRFIETLEMNLIAGRDFNPLLASDSTQSIIVNETFLSRHGMDQAAVGETFPIDWGWMNNPVIIGVVEDFNYQSLAADIEPAMMYMNPRDPILNMMIRIAPDQVQSSISKIESAWSSIHSDIPFTYSFLDQDMDELYRAEERWGKIIRYSSVFAIFIACLGLFGLAGISSIQRRKEIGIRKVMGASVQGILILLSKDFAKLILISVAVATPVAWYVLQYWLRQFAFRTDLDPGIFLIAGGYALLCTMLMVGWHAIRAATVNPVQSLRSE
ncbi:ABC transporter permease [Rhodohalobacter mucosus]|uniref:ABC transport system permease protein n=1 Tax=Rhodohalobacter mucosus TaxID=2079485 RepID=A0A316TYQ9_9BACT|nr:ABC transporter permease [Rhodohalobacter mucosus]PWN07954.1 hypothetical protein DDZ15_02785 [Rhodohalobacter mucosus]